MSWTGDVPELASLDTTVRRQLDAMAPVAMAEQTVLFRPGEAVKGYVVVLQGRVSVHLIGPTGRDILLYDVTPGKTCIQSTLGLLGGDDYTGEAIAEPQSKIVFIPKSTFLQLLDTAPAFRRLVFSAFAVRMQTMMHLLEQVAFQKVESRLAAYLLSRADSEGRLATTQQDIASAIGSAREVVSRRLDDLARRGCLDHARGEVRIIDAGALKRLADEPVF